MLEDPKLEWRGLRYVSKTFEKGERVRNTRQEFVVFVLGLAPANVIE